jgi:hypothetical protein
MKYSQLEESIYKLNPEDPMNPEVLVSGYGTMDLKTLERAVARDLENIAQRANTGDWQQVAYLINESPLIAKLDAITSAYDALEQQRARGGRNSRGINNR